MPSKKINWARLVKTGLLPLIIIAAAALWFSLPEVNDQIPLSSTSLTLTQPDSGANFPPNQAITIEAHLVSAVELSSIEWWVNGLLYESSPIDTPSADAHILYWAFTPQEMPSYQVMARALGSDGLTADSNFIHINIVEGSTGAFPITYLSQQGQSLEDIAAALGRTPEQLAGTNPDLPQAEPLPPDTPVQAFIPAFSPDLPDTPPSPPAAPQPPAPAANGGESPSPAPNKLVFWLGTLLNNSTPAAAPTLSFALQQCDLHLFIQDQSSNEQGFNIYRYNSNAAKQQIAQIGPSAGSGQQIEFSDSNISLPGATYVVAAFNQSGKSPSNLVQVVPAENCLAPDPRTGPSFEFSLAPDTPMDKTYCYYAINQAGWLRLPSQPSSFFTRTRSSADLSASLNPFSSLQLGDSLEMECWGWAADELHFLGRGLQTLPAERSMAFQLENAVLDLIWKPDLSGVDDPSVLAAGNDIVLFEPPYNFRATRNVADCAPHDPYGTGVYAHAANACRDEIQNQVISRHVLVWEWEPGPSACVDQPGIDCEKVEDPDGYYLYKYLSVNGQPVDFPGTMLYNITDSRQKVTTIPLNWAPDQSGFSWCYVIAAYEELLHQPHFFSETQIVHSNVLCEADLRSVTFK